MKTILILLLVISPVVPLNLYFAGSWYSLLHSYSIAMVFGIFSYVYFTNTLILSARIPLIDKVLGNDRVLRIHAVLAQTALFFAILHVVFKLVYSFTINVTVLAGIIAFVLFLLLMTLTVLYMNAGVFSKFKLTDRVNVFFKNRFLIDYSNVKLLHNGTVAAVLLIAFHCIGAASTAESSLRGTVMGGWTLIAVLIWIYHKIVRPFRNKRSRWKVSSVKKVAGNIVELKMENRNGRLFRGRAGQYAYFSFISKASGREEHPFTISSLPGRSDLTITVKQLGDYTQRLENVQPGVTALIDGPYGKFVPPEGVPCLFIAGGIGITPFIPIAEAKKNNGETAPVFLIWSVRNNEELFCKDTFETIQSEHPWFTFNSVVTKNGNGQSSGNRIDKTLISSLVNKSLFSELHVYICGPASLRVAMTTLLKNLGVNGTRIHSERFD